MKKEHLTLKSHNCASSLLEENGVSLDVRVSWKYTVNPQKLPPRFTPKVHFPATIDKNEARKLFIYVYDKNMLWM